VKKYVFEPTLCRALGLTLLGMAGSAFAQSATQKTDELAEVVVTGFRQSLEKSTEAKREATGFTDSIFAEDIGKFPDTNIAESLTRIPGIQLTRDVNGEGLNVAIRGLPNSFTKTVVNGVEVATASIGLNAQNQNREVDLNLFPTEFFNQLTVYKSPKASLVEGGAAGVVDMHNVRPFDNPGTHFHYTLEGARNTIADKFSPQASAIGSWTSDDATLGALVGVSVVQGKIGVEGYETIGWSNPNLSEVQCGVGTSTTTRPASCNTGGGNSWLMPDTVPDNSSTIGAGLTPGATIDAAFLTGHNPGLTVAQISEALMPRLGRPVNMTGDRNRYSTLGSFEWRPSDAMHFSLDMLYSKAHRTNDRIDINLVGRNFSANGMIPLDMSLDANNVVTSATMTNAQFFLEARPYRENVQYWHIDPGATFLFGDSQNIRLDVQGYKSRSWMHRESPTILVNSPFTTIDYTNDGSIPSWNTSIDLNDPNLGWTWAGGRVNVQNEQRHTSTSGGHVDLQLGDAKNNVRIGAAMDRNYRRIQGFDNSAAWQTYVLSQISDAQLPNYLLPGPLGFITADFSAFEDATNYTQFRDSAPESAGPNTGGSTGGFREKVKAAYIEVNDATMVWDREMRLNAGVRYAKTDQEIMGPVTLGGVRRWQTLSSSYDELLPAFTVAWDVAQDVVVRMSGSRTMTRPNPSSMLPNTTFTDPAAQVASQGNPNLEPYTSTNLDLGGEWYTGDEGFVGLTMFQKRVRGYTYQGTNSIPFSQLGISYADDLNAGQQGAIDARGGPDQAIVSVNQQVNADGILKIRGWEAIWVQPLGFITRGLGVMFNYTDIKLTPSGKDAAKLGSNVFGIAPKLWNATTYWENFGASVRVSYNWTDGYATTGPNQNNLPPAQIYGVKRGQWDLSSSYQLKGLPGKLQVTLDVLNITDNAQRSNFWHSNMVNDYYDPGRTIMLGLRGNF
jgi:TonB-dependent receptor